eukprot:15448963-Alexandrium_andersonii.AAC.1
MERRFRAQRQRGSPSLLLAARMLGLHGLRGLTTALCALRVAIHPRGSLMRAGNDAPSLCSA